MLWLLIVAFLWVVVSRFVEVEKLAQTLASGRLGWVAVALLAQAVYYLVFTASYQAAFASVEVKSRLRDLLPVTFASLFLNVAAPAGGASGAALFVDDAGRRGESPVRAAAGTLLQLISDFSAFTLVLLAGMAVLFVQHDLKAYEILAAFALLGITVGLSLVLTLGLWKPALLRRLLDWVERAAAWLAGRLGRASFLQTGWAEKASSDFRAASIALVEHPRGLMRTLGISLAAHLLDLASLYILFLAFYQPVKPGLLVAGYAMGILFWIVSPVPQGIGVVEGMMALVYTSLGVPGPIAVAVSLAFRGLTFWLPLVLGFLLLRRLKTFNAA